LHQVGDLFELNVKLRCQKVKYEGDIRTEEPEVVLKRKLKIERLPARMT